MEAMRVPVSITMEKEEFDILRHFCQKSGVPLTTIYREYTRSLVRTIKAAKLDQKQTYTKLDIVKFFAKGVMQDV